MTKLKILILFFIILLGISLRLYKFDNPIADWHSWRQADTSSVSRNFVENGFDILHPRFHDISNVQSKKPNPEGYRFVEFPIYNLFQAGLYEASNFLSLEEWGRLVTIFSSIGILVLIYLILKKHLSEKAGLIGAFFYSTLPFSIYYGRTILPDTLASFAILLGVYFFDNWLSTDKRNKVIFSLLFFVSIIFTASALLIKPFTIFFVLPMIYLAYEKYGKKIYSNIYLWIFAIFSIMPFLLWRVWMLQFPEGIPVSAWLFNGDNIRFKPSFFYWIFAERVGKLILGYFGIAILFLGLISDYKRKLFFLTFLASSTFYLFVVARGNVQHDYYQILILPSICIFLGIGGDRVLRDYKNKFDKYLKYSLFVVFSGFTIFFSWHYVKDYFNINNSSIIKAGEAVDRLTPKDSLVIANYDGDTSFLYQTKRSGWASYQHELEKMKSIGADYLVIVNPKPLDFEFAKAYKVEESNVEYVIFNLNLSK